MPVQPIAGRAVTGKEQPGMLDGTILEQQLWADGEHAAVSPHGAKHGGQPTRRGRHDVGIEKKEVLDAFEKAGITGGGTGAPAAALKAAKKPAAAKAPKPKESERRAAVRARWSALVRAR